MEFLEEWHSCYMAVVASIDLLVDLKVIVLVFERRCLMFVR